jgi:AbrB family looped-hinge helix DNA binding protein
MHVVPRTLMPSRDVLALPTGKAVLKLPNWNRQLAWPSQEPIYSRNVLLSYEQDMAQEPEVTTVSEKGQVVIPQSLRKELGIKPKTKLLVFGRGDTVIMKKLELPDLRKEWDAIFKAMDAKRLKISEKEVLDEVAAVRRERHRTR